MAWELLVIGAVSVLITTCIIYVVKMWIYFYQKWVGRDDRPPSIDKRFIVRWLLGLVASSPEERENIPSGNIFPAAY